MVRIEYQDMKYLSCPCLHTLKIKVRIDKKSIKGEKFPKKSKADGIELLK